MQHYSPRSIDGMLREALSRIPVVMLEGARQVGKTTTVKKICEEAGGEYLTLDQPFTFDQAASDPLELLSVVERGNLVVVDEIQLMPSLFRVIKYYVDKDRRPGMFLVTGSGDRHNMKTTIAPLAGRAVSKVLRPLSQSEVLTFSDVGGPEEGSIGESRPSGGIIEAMADGEPPRPLPGFDLPKAVGTGGYPECVLKPEKKEEWISYVFEHDIAAAIRRVSKSGSVRALPRFLRQVAARLGKQANLSKIAREMSESVSVARALYDLLCNEYIIEPLPGHHKNYRKIRMASRDKLYLNDTGLATTLLSLDGQDLPATSGWGMLVENYVLNQLRNDVDLHHLPNSVQISHFIEHDGVDIDFVVSLGSGGDVIPIEVKAATKVRRPDTKNIREFKRIAGKRCKRAVVVYGGDEAVELDGGVLAWPVSCLRPA